MRGKWDSPRFCSERLYALLTPTTPLHHATSPACNGARRARSKAIKSIQFSFPKSLFFVVFLISLFLFMLRGCSSLVVLFSSLVAGKVCSSQDSVLVHKKEQAKIKHDAAHGPHQALPNPPIRLTECVPSHEVRSSNVDLSSGYHIPRALCRGTVHVNRGNCSPQMQTEGNAYA